MHRLTRLASVAALVLTAASSGFSWSWDFESGLGQDGQPISSGVSGVTFTTTDGFDWLFLDHTTGNYNTSSDNGLGNQGSYWLDGNVAAWLGVNQGSGRIDFDNKDGSFFSIDYSAAHDFYLEAYDENDVLIDVDSGPDNLRYGANDAGDMGTLTVNSASNNIAYVVVHDQGNFFLVDNISGDATGVRTPGDPAIPEPTTMLLFGLGLVGSAAYRRFKN